MSVDKFTGWEAGFLRRWHANPDMCECGDTVSSHSHRMSVLAIHLFKPSRALLEYIALHDLGEVGSGDVAYPFKKAHPDCYKTLEEFGDKTTEEMGFVMPILDNYEQAQLWLLDRLDSILFMYRYNPTLALKKEGWVAGIKDVKKKADELGVRGEVEKLIYEVRYGRN